MYNSESISQVYGVIIEYLDQLPEKERKCLKDLIYDDNCHMAKFALKNAKVNPNELTNFLANDVRKTLTTLMNGVSSTAIPIKLMTW